MQRRPPLFGTRPNDAWALLRLGRLVVTLSVLLATSAGFWVASSASAQSGRIQINQKRSRIENLIQQVGEASGRTILVPDDVRGSISVVAKRSVSIDEAWSILESSLSILGYTLLPSTAGTWRISKVAEAVGEAPFRLTARSDSESYITTLIPLRIATPADVLKVLEPLSGGRVTLVPYAQTNSVIASGSERAIARLTTIADELDQVEEETLRLRVLRYRGVTEVESVIESFLDSLGREGRSVQVWSDKRTNAMVIRGDQAAVDRVVGFVNRIDQPVKGGGAIQILRVLHRDVEEVAEMIRSLADPGVAATSEASAAATPLDGSEFSIAVDGPSHSLIIRSDPQLFSAIREVLEILDAPVELIAVDITISELRTPSAYGLALGFVAPFATGNNTDDLFGVVAHDPTVGGLASASNIVGRVQRDTGVSFLAPGANGVPVTVPILQSATVSAADFEGTNDILIEPSLVVTAGEAHEIFVGQNIPLPVSNPDPVSTTAVGGIPAALISRTIQFDRRDIGTRLGIEANVGREGKIQLQLQIELSELNLASASLGGNPQEVGPSFIEQSLSVTARLDDGEIAVLAMNKQRKEIELRTGIPFLRDIPFLGAFFSAEGTVSEDTRLIIVARARRVSSPAELVADTIRRRLTFERRSARTGTLPKVTGSPYGVRVTTRRLEDDATAITESLSLQGYRAITHPWSIGDIDYFDVYVINLPSMAEAGAVAEVLSREGWSTDLVVMSDRP